MDINVRFAWWVLFTSAGWEYYLWLDSFVEKMSRAISFEQFIRDIGWHSAKTALIVARRETAQSHGPANRPLQPTSGNEPDTDT